MTRKALWIEAKAETDFEKIVSIAKAEAMKILHGEKVKVLNVLPSNNPVGYAVVVESLG